MATIIGTLPVKILTQIGDNEPIHVGTYELPVKCDDDGKLSSDTTELFEWLQDDDEV